MNKLIVLVVVIEIRNFVLIFINNFDFRIRDSQFFKILYRDSIKLRSAHCWVDI